MKGSKRVSFWESHPVMVRAIVLTGVSLSVYFFFRYLFLIFFPFFLAWFFMKLLMPLIRFLENRFHFPRWLADASALLLFFAAVFGGFFFVGWQMWRQLRMFLANFPIYRQILWQLCSDKIHHFCLCMDDMFCMQSGSCENMLQQQGENMSQFCCKLLSNHAGGVVSACLSGSIRFLAAFFITIVAMTALCQDMEKIRSGYQKLPYHFVFQKISRIMKNTGFAYLKAQAVIVLIIWLLCSGGIFLIKNPYAIWLGLFIAIFDAFPIFGSGMILAPWGIYQIACGNYFVAAVLFTVWLGCTLTREFLEGHLIGHHVGLLPFFTTAAIYAGICLFGVCGIFFGPFSVILIRAIYQEIVS